MSRSAVLLLVVALAGCRPSPAAAERAWADALRASLPAGWVVLVVTGDPAKNRLTCWFEAPGPGGRTCRVELRVAPRADAPGERDWAVNVHPPAGSRPPPASAYFTVAGDGAGPVEVAPRSQDDPAAAEAVRPLAEEAVRRVRELGLF